MGVEVVARVLIAGFHVVGHGVDVEVAIWLHIDVVVQIVDGPVAQHAVLLVSVVVAIAVGLANKPVNGRGAQPFAFR